MKSCFARLFRIRHALGFGLCLMGTMCLLTVTASAAPAPKPVVLDFEPKSTMAGESFNLSTNGRSTLTVRSKGASFRTVVVFGGTELETSMGSFGIATAYVPPDLLAEPGERSIVLLDKKTGQKSDTPAMFTIEGPAIVDYGPKSIRVGEPFNVQADGHSAFWFKTRNISRNCVVLFDGTELPTRAGDDGMVTAEALREVIDRPGTHEIRILDRPTNHRTAALFFEVGVLAIIDFGPQSTQVGVPFNLQPNDDSALWFTVEHARGKLVAVMDGVELETVTGAMGAASAIVAPELFAEPGQFEIVVLEKDSGLTSAPVVFEVLPAGPPSLPTAPPHPPTTLKLLVTRDRMYRLTGWDIAQHGIDLKSIHGDRLNIRHRGRPIPILVENLANDGTLTPESAILFWGEFPRGETTRRNFFTKENAYMLRFDDEAPFRRMIQRQASADIDIEGDTLKAHRKTARLEEDLETRFLEHYTGRDTDRVMWKTFQAPPRGAQPLPIPLVDDQAPGAELDKIRILLWGNSYLMENPDHRWEIALNDTPLGTAEWDARTHCVFEADIPSGAYRDGEANTLSLRNLHEGATIDSVSLDWIEFDYNAKLEAADDFLLFDLPYGRLADPSGFSAAPPRAFNVDDGEELDRVAGVGFHCAASTETKRIAVVGPNGFVKPDRIIATAPARLKALDAAPEYLAITHRRFLPALEPLIEHRRSQGLTVMAVDVEDIYDEYNGGIFSPEAIRRFLDDMLSKSEAAERGLRYVFLVGDATYDYMGVKGGRPNDVPTFHVESQRSIGVPIYAVDNYFAYGPDEESQTPQAAVGRFPCARPESLADYVEKIIEYETQDAPPTEERALLIAGTGFASYCDELANDYLDAWERVQAYSKKDDIEGNLALQDTIVDTLNRGCDVVYFAGHGGYWVWRTGSTDLEGQTDMFTNDHVGQLTNAGRYPIVFSTTCYSALFDSPGYPRPEQNQWVDSGIGTYMVEAPRKGAIACIGHVGESMAAASHRLVGDMLDEIVHEGNERLGDAFLHAKQKFVGPQFWGLTLIGDPALILPERFQREAAPATANASEDAPTTASVFNPALTMVSP